MPRIGWPGVRSGKLNQKSGYAGLSACSFAWVPLRRPRAPPGKPPQRAVKPTPEFLTVVSAPRTMETQWSYGASYRELRALYDHRPTEGRDILAQSSTVPPTTRAVARQIQSHETLCASRQLCSLWLAKPLNSHATKGEVCLARHWGQCSCLTRLVAVIRMTMVQWHSIKSPPGFSKERKTKADALSLPRLVSFA